MVVIVIGFVVLVGNVEGDVFGWDGGWWGGGSVKLFEEGYEVYFCYNVFFVS